MWRCCKAPQCAFPVRALSTLSGPAASLPDGPRIRRQDLAFRRLPHQRPAPSDRPRRPQGNRSSQQALSESRLPSGPAPPEQAEMASLIERRDLEGAQTLADKLAGGSLASQAQTMRIFLEGLIAGGRADLATTWLNSFLGANPDKFACTSVMRALVRVHRVDEAASLFKRMQNKDAIAGSVLGLGYLQEGRLDDLARLILELERLRPPPAAPLYRALFSGLVSQKKMEEASVFAKSSSNPEMLARCSDLLVRLGVDDAANKAVQMLTKASGEGGANAGATGKAIIGTLVELSRRGKTKDIEKMVAQISSSGSATLADAQSVLLDNYVNAKRFDDVRALLETIKNGPYSLWLLQASLKALVALGDVRAAATLLAEAPARHGVQVDAAAYNSVLTGWVRLRKISEAEALLEAMTTRGLAPTQVSYVALLRGYLDSGDLQKAEFLIAKMRRQGVRPSPVAWSALLTLLANKDTKAAVKRLRQVEEEGYTPSPELYNALISRLAKTDFAAAVEMKNRLLRGAHKPNEVTYNSLIHPLLRKNDVNTADGFCNEMQGLGLKPDLLMCRDMARAWRAAGDMDKAALWEKKIDAFGLGVAKVESEAPSPAVLLLRKALTAVSEGKLTEARQFVQALRSSSGAQLDDFAAIGRRMASKGLLTEVRWLITETRAAGFGQDATLWNVLLGEQVRAMKESEVEALLKEMEIEGVRADAVTYALMLTMLARTNKLEEAEAIFRSMPDRGVTPTAFVCNRLMQAYAKSGDTKKAAWLLQQMEEQGVAADQNTYLELVRVYVTAGDISSALKIADDKAEVLPPSAFVFLIKALERSKEHDTKRINALKERMVHARKKHNEYEMSYAQFRCLLDER